MFHSNANYENNISSSDTNSKTDDKDVFVPQSICELLKVEGIGYTFYLSKSIFSVVLCTLPIGSAPVERTFSKIKLIKTRLKSTTRDIRLDHFMLISCEVHDEMDFDKTLYGIGAISSVYAKLCRR